MAYNKKYPKIERVSKNSPHPNRFGIKFANLSRQQKRLLIDNKVIEERTGSDQFVHIIFELCQHRYTSAKDKFYYDGSTDSFVKMEELKENYNTVDWTCALSGEPIRSKTDNFSLENFVHPDYHDALLAPMVDSRILKSSIAFRKYVKKLLLNQQQEFMRLARKNSRKKLD